MSHEPASKGRRTVWTVVSTVILALGLFGCSGGGGGGNVVGITPQPPGGDHPNTRANAAVVRPGQEIEATLASADDVDFFRIDLAERQEIKFTLDAEAGIEIAVLDSDGAVIATAVTESKVETTISAAGRIFIRVRDKTKRGWDRLNRTRGVKAYSFISNVVDVAKTIINIKRGIPHYMLSVGGVGVDFDLHNHFTLPDGRRVVSNVTASLPGVEASIQGTTVRLSASGATVPGGVRIVLKLCIPLTSYCFHEAFAATVIPPPGRWPARQARIPHIGRVLHTGSRGEKANHLPEKLFRAPARARTGRIPSMDEGEEVMAIHGGRCPAGLPGMDRRTHRDQPQSIAGGLRTCIVRYAGP